MQINYITLHYNIINNNAKFKDQMEVEFVTSRNMCIYINIPKS